MEKPSAAATVRRVLREQLGSREGTAVLYVAFVVFIVGFSLTSPVFLTANNLSNILRQTSLVSIIAVGMAMVIISAEIDLSVGSTMALGGVAASLAMRDYVDSWVVGALVGLAAGACVGLLNGLLVARVRIPSFLVTLATLNVASGVALIISNTQPVLVTNSTYWAVFAEGSIAGLTAPIAWTVVVVIIGAVVLHFSTFGRRLYATGGNQTAARYSGINTARVKILAFVITGMLAGLAGIILSARGHALRPDVGGDTNLDVIAAVILGGTSLFGGVGTIWGVVLGSLLIGILNNGLVLLGLAPAIVLAIKGTLIIAAVAFRKS